MQHNKILWKNTSAILFRDWDPIGINDDPECEHEYDDYVGNIYRLIEEDADEIAMAKYLIHVETQIIGLNSLTAVERGHRIAKQLHNLKH